ncbi:MAG: hypothetical protein KDB07_06905, partial [Planctomycetes bacterium]|nr:hypothetical protein [Planctomycetota bacterium]
MKYLPNASYVICESGVLSASFVEAASDVMSDLRRGPDNGGELIIARDCELEPDALGVLRSASLNSFEIF